MYCMHFFLMCCGISRAKITKGVIAVQSKGVLETGCATQCSFSYSLCIHTVATAGTPEQIVAIFFDYPKEQYVVQT
ncbi:hypothetical protein DFH11DRAFT_121852 [Phellopilus nigrolimitatus]|nr:hypothetical protein DFH11DRAFT_121852 [Phellopilus nigrolimitatus]